MTLVSSLNYVIWESYKPKTVSAPFLSIFVSSVLWFWPWHFSNFAQKWNSMVQVDRSRWDLYNGTSFELKLCYLKVISQKLFPLHFCPFLSHRFCDFDPGISPISLKSEIQWYKDRSQWDLYNNASFELKLCYLRKL